MTKRSIVLYMHVHQPYRVKKYSIFGAGHDHDYFSESDTHSGADNEFIMKKVAEKSYRPMNAVLERMLNDHPDFKFSFSITGTFIEQAEKWCPDVLESFKRLVATGRAEIVAETYYHSLAFFYSRDEFERQVKMHQKKIKEVFGVETKVFRNTELSYNNELAKWAEDFGFQGIMAEGWDPVLEWRSPNHVYRPEGTSKIGLLLKNYRLSDDLAFRFSDKNWKEWPLQTDKYLKWIQDSAINGPLINLFMDYETFGEHQWEDTGIFNFFEDLIRKWSGDYFSDFLTVSDALKSSDPIGELSMPYTVTWADTERDLSAWLGNSMQHEAMRHIYDLEADILATDNKQLIHDWRNLQTSDHVYYMCTKYFNDGDVHAYFSPYDSPYNAFLYYSNVLRDLRWRLSEITKKSKEDARVPVRVASRAKA
jgi:Alpha-amylase/alpha-mannosidase